MPALNPDGSPNTLPTWDQAMSQTNSVSGSSLGLMPSMGFSSGSINEFGLQSIMDLAEQYAGAVGWRYIPSQSQLMAAYRSGVNSLAAAGRFWGSGLPKRLQYVKFGMTADQFEKYKLDNRQSIVERFGAHADQNDANFVENIEHPIHTFQASGGSVKQAQNAIGNETHSVVR